MLPVPTNGKISWLDIIQAHVGPRHLDCHSFGLGLSLCSTYSSGSLLQDANLPVCPRKNTLMVLNTPAIFMDKGRWAHNMYFHCRKNGFEKSFFYWYCLCIFTEIWGKKNAAFFSSSTQWDTENLKNFSLGLGSLALLLVVSKSKGIKRPIHVQDKKENSPFCCCPESEMQKMGIQRCPAVTFCCGELLNSLISWPWSFLVSPWGEQGGSQGVSSCPFALLLMLWSVTLGLCFFRSHLRKSWTLFLEKGWYFP